MDLHRNAKRIALVTVARIVTAAVPGCKKWKKVCSSSGGVGVTDGSISGLFQIGEEA